MLKGPALYLVTAFLCGILFGSLVGWRAAQQKYRDEACGIAMTCGDRDGDGNYDESDIDGCLLDLTNHGGGILELDATEWGVDSDDCNCTELRGQKFRWRGMYEECQRVAQQVRASGCGPEDSGSSPDSLTKETR